MSEEKRRGLFKRFAESLFEDVAVTESEAAEAIAPPEASISTFEPAPTNELVPLPGTETIAKQNVERSQTLIAAETLKFQTRLKELMEQADAPVAGKLQLLDLDDIREKLGPRWEAAAAKARTIAEQVIQHRLTAADVVAPFDEDSFIILFAELNEEQSRLKAAAIAREVREKLLGELGIGDPHWVKAFVTSLAPFKPKNIISKDEMPEAERPPIPNPPPVIGPLTLKSLNILLVGTEDLAATLEQNLDADLQHRTGEVGVTFRPTWYVPRGVISVFDCRALRLDALNVIYTGDEAYPKSDNAVTFEIDRIIVQRALRKVRTMLAKQARGIFVVPVHLQSLTAHSGGQLVDLFHAEPEIVRQHVVAELLGLNQPGLILRLGQAVTALQPFCRSITARVGANFTDLDRLTKAGVHSVCIDLDGEDAVPDLTPYKLTGLLRGFAERAQHHKMTPHLYGLKDKALISDLIDFGYIYLNGPAIAAEISQPLGLQPYSLDAAATPNETENAKDPPT